LFPRKAANPSSTGHHACRIFFGWRTPRGRRHHPRGNPDSARDPALPGCSFSAIAAISTLQVSHGQRICPAICRAAFACHAKPSGNSLQRTHRAPAPIFRGKAPHCRAPRSPPFLAIPRYEKWGTVSLGCLHGFLRSQCDGFLLVSGETGECKREFTRFWNRRRASAPNPRGSPIRGGALAKV